MSPAKAGKRATDRLGRKLPETERRRRIRELRGKYADSFPSVDEFLRVKHAEVEAGEREWEKIRSERRSPGTVGGKIMTRTDSGSNKKMGKMPSKAKPTKARPPMTHEQLVRSIFGKYAFVRFSSDDHVREKAREIEREG